MENNKLFRKECYGEELLMEGMDDYSRVPTPRFSILSIVVVFAMIVLLVFGAFHKIDIDYYTFAEVADGKLYVYFTNDSLPQIDNDTEIVIADKHIKYIQGRIEKNNMVENTEKDEKKYNVLNIFSKLYYYIIMNNPGLNEGVYEAKVVFAKKCLAEYLFEIGKK